ncbi:hypothetical protein OS493_036394 [Desmophyllum pertusum]|uniref:G-protein coupled receptors family 2 profile 2 domain-containing protein n=1 Tax=Desmophyllum pertusum TaxID=174260 RepID=A0A9X0D7P7_9CNID|nr:hypothetical protein OS493_036394 [Desmophyllum pertusum]
MIGSCPSPWINTTTAHACMSTNHSADPAVALPVLDTTTNVTYANIYCAMCHGKSRDLHHWNLRIARTPKKTPTLQDTRSADTLWEVVPVGGIIPKKCVLTPSKANTGPDTKIKQLCRSYSNAIYVLVDDRKTPKLPFKNPHCALLSNPNVFVNKSRVSKLYNNDSYILVNQTLILCTNFSRNYTSHDNPAKVTPAENAEKPPSHALVFRILTYVGFSLSIIALLFLLVTYFLFSELRTYPGKMVMHFSCAMIAMQSVYFASDPDVVSSAVCAVMGALLHYFILAVFLWMSVIAHNTHKTFSTLNVDPHNPLVIAKRKKSYIRYSVFTWGFPIVIVGICLTLQLTNTGNVGYGNEDGCQLSLPARTFAVAVPVSAMLLFNIVAVVRAAVAIKQQLGQGNAASAGNQPRLPVIVLKMTVVMGITWILGFVLAFHPTPYLEYPFTIINSCQGVLICISFVFKKHVFTLYKQRFMVAPQPEPTTNAAEQ